jgi:hypothetical protein
MNIRNWAVGLVDVYFDWGPRVVATALKGLLGKVYIKKCDQKNSTLGHRNYDSLSRSVELFVCGYVFYVKFY